MNEQIRNELEDFFFNVSKMFTMNRYAIMKGSTYISKMGNFILYFIL